MLAQLPAEAPFPAVGILFLSFTLFWVGATAFWIWMLYDCLTKKRWPETEKLVWAMVLLFSHVIGAVVYFFVVKVRKPGGSETQS